MSAMDELVQLADEYNEQIGLNPNILDEKGKKYWAISFSGYLIGRKNYEAYKKLFDTAFPDGIYSEKLWDIIYEV